MREEDIITSSLNRFFKLSSLVGKVSASVLSEKFLAAFRSESSQETHMLKNLRQNAQRIVETLGKLKGAAMKVGQMLSLYEGLFPPEVLQILSALQKETPSVPFEVMEAEIKNELKDSFALFQSIDPVAYAAASIGQVHRAQLVDGRNVAIKIQYPAMDEIIKADLKNLKTLLSALLSLFTKIDTEPVWAEMKERLLEELDYRKEAANIERTKKLYAQNTKLIIPKVIANASTQRVITMELLEGISAQRACGDEFSYELKCEWGRVLLDYIMSGLFEHKFLHVDPNVANFAFREDGRVIVYDFGCMKKVPEMIATGIAKMARAVLDDDKASIPALLKETQVYRANGELLPREVTDLHVEIFQNIFRKSPPYMFGEDSTIYAKVFKLAKHYWQEASDIKFPQDFVFIDRTISGHFGNLSKLKARANWRDMLEKYVAIGLGKSLSEN